MSDALVTVVDLHKSFGGIEVLKGIDIAFRAGEIHAFLGANGAGKSTFLGCLSGAVRPTQGNIKVAGGDYESLSPRTALNMGIGIIYQHYQIFEDLTVADNIFLGRECLRMGMVDTARHVRESAVLLERLGVRIDPRMQVRQLGTGERKIVEIARALNTGPRLLILDEPTAALGEHEIAAVHDVVRHVAKTEGLGVVYVTHLLDEVDEIADRVTILRNGRIVWSRPKPEVSTADMAEAIAPSSARIAHVRSRDDLPGDPLVELRDYRSPYTGPVNLVLRPGEAVGIYGLLGSGRTDLLESLFGARPRQSGELLLRGKPVDIRTPAEALARGISLVASDRGDQSVFQSLDAVENLLMPHHGTRLLPGFLRSRRKEDALFDRVARDLSVHPADPRLNIENFSGGNAQKIVLGRWLLDSDDTAKIILLDEPTQGVDIGARAQLYEALRVAMDRGACVIFGSSDPAEIVELADRALVLAYGAPVALIDKPFTEGTLVELAHKMAGGGRSSATQHVSTASSPL